MNITDISVMERMTTNTGDSVEKLSYNKPILLVFLRHFGCVFCREALKDIAGKRKEFKEKGVNVVFVHMSDVETAEKYFNNYGLPNTIHVSDPECKYYIGFGLVKGTFSQLFGLKNMIRGMELTLKGNAIGLTQVGDGFQMPGIFMINKGRISDSYIHKTAADRPNYDKIINCCLA